MDRRQYLTGLSMGILSGCTGQKIGRNDDSTKMTGSMYKMGVVQESRDSIEFQTDIVRIQSPKTPAKINLEVTNNSDTPQSLSFGPVVPFSNLLGEKQDGDGQIVLVPDNRSNLSWVRPSEEDFVPNEQVDGCWKVQGQLVMKDVRNSRTLGPGEGVSEDYTVLLSHDSKCNLSGKFTFSNTIVADDKDAELSFEILRE